MYFSADTEFQGKKVFNPSRIQAERKNVYIQTINYVHIRLIFCFINHAKDRGATSTVRQVGSLAKSCHSSAKATENFRCPRA